MPNFRGALDACLQGLSQKLNVVFRVRHYLGGTRIFNARATARAPEHGTIRRVVGLTIDITESYAIHMRAERIASVLDRKSTRLNSVTNAHLVCRLLLEKKTYFNLHNNQ